MAAPSSSEELLDLVRRSGVIDEKRLEPYLQQLRASIGVPPEPGKLAGLMVRDGLLTHFQAEQFLLGKWRRFTIGKYKVLERLGSGGMGSVYLCEHKFMRRRVAVKVLPAAKAEDPSSLERFYREARAAAALDHPNIVRAYDIDQEDNLHFLVMEYVDGASLQDMVKKFGPMSPQRAAHYIRQSAIGLQHAHEAGLVHRDIKPGNVLVDRGGTVKVLDMGLARFFHDEEDLLTKKYDESVLGTADYLAPEQALDSHSVDIRADIYSLGATFYYILTGQPPFNEGTVAQKLIWHQTRQPKAIKTYRQDVPEAMLAVIDRMMAKDLKDRFQKPSDVIDALAPFTQVPIAPPADVEMPRLSPAAMGSNPSEPVAVPPSPSSSVASLGGGPRTAQRSSTHGSRSGPPSSPSSSEKGGSIKPKVEPSRPTRVSTPPQGAGNGAPRPEPPPPPLPPVEEAPAWESLAVDTEKAAAAKVDTEPPSHSPSPSKKGGKPRSEVITAGDRRRFRLVTAVAALSVLVAVAAGLYLILRGDRTATPTGSGVGPPPARLVVGKTAEDGYRTIREALNRAKPGDVIAVTDEVHEEYLELIDGRAPRDVTIEAAHPDGKAVTWRLPANFSDARKLMVLGDVEGLRVKGFILDGQDRVDDVVNLTKFCTGLVLEDMQLIGFKTHGLQLVNAASRDSSRPIVLQRLLIMPTAAKDAEAALRLLALPNITNPHNNEHIQVRACRLAGPYKAVVQIDGRLNDVHFQHNRLFNAEDGLIYNKSAGPSPEIKLVLESNTFCKVTRNGLNLVTMPVPREAVIEVRNNLFVQVGKLAEAGRFFNAGDVAFVLPSPDGNVRDSVSKEGNCDLRARVIQQFPSLPQNPAEDATFLCYPADSLLSTAGLNGGPVGFPPR